MSIPFAATSLSIYVHCGYKPIYSEREREGLKDNVTTLFKSKCNKLIITLNHLFLDVNIISMEMLYYRKNFRMKLENIEVI